MPTLTPRRPSRQAPPSIQDRADLLALQWTHGVEVLPRLAAHDDAAELVRAVVGQWRTRPGAGGPMPLHTARLWLREWLCGTERRLRGSARAAATAAADELLCAALADDDAGLVVVPLRRRQCA